ncbi:hypothetical protein [Asticcacaulis machinosus]|uniref:HEPN AbiU2-like domain-containing protein n=1 Tax=Asticcacaulis machinosus TaxID=2984211 RepID=A0ABT5HG76_9CAUL|nr:hypothetical protein [Asticcacaulis machinosus]MDC7675257.1 hypothetical protein [Asticcacaulis machinosus]
MDFSISDHFEFVILKQLEEYDQAEQRLTDAVLSKDSDLINLARFDALRIGTNAIWHVHHFAEIVFTRINERGAKPSEAEAFRQEIEHDHCRCLRSGAAVNDISILADAADALKHSILRRTDRLVSSRDQVLATSSEYGIMSYKYGGVDEVVILCNDNTKRFLTTCLENVVAAWRDYLTKHGHIMADHGTDK